MIAGQAVLSILKADSPRSLGIGLEVIYSVGAGIVYSGVVFPVLAPLNIQQQPQAMAFLGFVRSLGQVSGFLLPCFLLTEKIS